MHSVTRLRLDEFRRRRNQLLLARGLAAALLSILVAGLICIAVDAWWILESIDRWKMAGFVYGTAAVILIGFVARPWLRGRSTRFLAEHIERIEPNLRERLTAAIELDADESRLDSWVFREALQQSVARRIDGLDVRSALPWRIIGRWFWIAIVGLLVIGLLCCLPWLYFPSRLGRVFLPMVDIGRVSRYAVELSAPASTFERIPDDEVQLIRAKVHGGKPARVRMEWSNAAIVNPEPVELYPAELEFSDKPVAATDANIYQLQWTPPTGKTRFRVNADDAVSAWHEFETSPRPKVVGFEIEYRYPAYTQLPNHRQPAREGDVQALVGTHVQLAVKTNLERVDGGIVIRPKDRARAVDSSEKIISFERDGTGSLTAEFPVEFNATYRIDLRSADTGFTNAFSPTYSITALDDRPPIVRWQTPDQTGVAVRPNDILSMSVAVDDEVQIASMVQQVRAGQGEWIDIPREPPSQAQGSTDFEFDILPLSVKPGDLVQTQIKAFDRKGQFGTSEKIELYVAGLIVDPAKQAALRKRSEIVDMLKAFDEEITQQADELKTARDRSKADPANELAAEEARQAEQNMSESIQNEAAVIRSAITNQLRDIQDSVTSEEYELLARNLARIESNPDNTKEIGNLAKRARDFVAHDVTSYVAQELKVLQNHQQELLSGYHRLQPEQFRRRQALVARQMQDLAAVMRDQLPNLSNRSAKAGKQWLDWIESQASKILEVTGKPERASPNGIGTGEGRRLADQVLAELNKHQNFAGIDGSLSSELLKARTELDQRAGTASTLIDAIAESMEATGDPNTREAAEKQLVQNDLPALEQLAARRETQQARRDGDPLFVADLGEIHRAAESIFAEHSDDLGTAKAKLEKLQEASGKLEALHATQQAIKTLKQVYDGERWESGSLESTFERPRVWEAFQQQMTKSLNDLRKAGLSPADVDAIESAFRSEPLKRIGGKIDPRRWSSGASASAASEIEALQALLKPAMENLNAVENEARQSLASLTPSVSEIARNAARQVDQAKRETEQLESAVVQDQVPDMQPRMQQLEQAWEQSDMPLKRLREGLADLASRQNLMQANSSRIARDADAAIALTHEAKKRLDDSEMAVRDVLQDPAAVREALASDAQTRMDVVSSMNKLADYFERLAKFAEAESTSPQETQPTVPSELSDQLAQQPELNQAHNNADRLQRLATLDPKRVLSELERELKRSKPMQAELSEIAKDAVGDALKTLEFSADKENEIAVDLENSDPAFEAKKEMLRSEVKRLAQATRRLTENISPRIEMTAERAQQSSVAKQARKLREGLTLESEDADKLASTDSFQEIFDSAKRLHQELESYSRLTQHEAGELQSVANQSKLTNTTVAKIAMRVAEELRSRFRDEDVRRAFDAERDRMLETKEAEHAVQRAQQNVLQKEKELAAAEKKPENMDRDVKVARRRAEKEKADASLLSTQAQLAAAEARQATAREIREAVQMRKHEDFSSGNAIAELGSQVASETAEAAQKLADELKLAAAEAIGKPEALAAAEALSSGMESQNALRQDVEQAAEELSRASRHEERMSNSTKASMLEQQASQVGDLAKGSLSSAGQKLDDAMNKAAGESNRKASAESTSESMQALASAESELRKQAQALKGATAAKADGSKSSAVGAERSASSSSGQLLSPQEMARMLDELDHLLNSAMKDPEKQAAAVQNSKPSQSSNAQGRSSRNGEPTPASPAESTKTLAEAAEKLASEMNQQRQAMESSSQNPTSTGSPDSTSRSAMQLGQDTSAMVPAVAVLSSEDWGKLREQSADEAREGDREEIPSAYRALVEEYFRRLSQRKPSKP
jgi:hypothetical protein